jgi:hypothetical protein
MVGMAMSALLVVALSKPELVAAFGVRDSNRVLSDSMLDRTVERSESSATKPHLAPVLYLLSETAGLNPKGWQQFDSSWWRGALAIPWIALVVPCFALGIRSLVAPSAICRHGRPGARGWIARLRGSDAVATAWSAVLLFVASSLVISMVVGDSTRWRVPDMPMFASIALLGWTRASSALRAQALFWWNLVLASVYGMLVFTRAM